MKKILLLFTSFPIFLNAQQTYVPDDNFESFLEINGMGNGVFYDDYVTTSNINTITHLDISGGAGTAVGVFDLTGIEDFTDLTFLSCYYNNIVSLDLSNNASLDTLICYNNQLTNLNVSNNTALTYLYCSYNQLTSLDVSNNTALTDFYCSDNQLTSLNISNNTALTDLGCSDNLLTNLDVSNNIDLTDLYCSENQLTSLDVSNNINLTDLSCYDNELTSLDVSNNIDLTDLYCSDNLLTSLDVSNNTALAYFSCNTNLITSLDVSNNINLTEFICTNNEFSCLNLKNGNNANMQLFYASSNLNLTCIEVDDPIWSTANWTAPYEIDSGLTFSINCNYPLGCFSIPTIITKNINNIELYPNPTNNLLNIELNNPNNFPYELAIYDNLGRKVHGSNFIIDEEIEVDVRDFKNGIYHYTLFCPTQNLKSTGKFIKN